MYHVDLHDIAEEWLTMGSTLIPDTIDNVREIIGEPDDLHEDVESFEDSWNKDQAIEDAVEAVADALHDDIDAMIQSYLDKYGNGFIADAVQEAITNQFENWCSDAVDESKELREAEAEDEDEDEGETNTTEEATNA